MTALVRAAALTNYAEVAGHRGLNAQKMLRAAGLSPAHLADPEQTLPVAAVIGLLESSAAAAACPTFGLRMAESRELSDFGAISLLLSHQQTLRDALRTVIEFRYLLNESLAIDLDESGETVVLREELVADTSIPSCQAIELAIGVMFRLCAALLGTRWHPRSVHFTHPAPPDLNVHRRVFGARFGCRIEFDSEFNGIVCPAEDLDFVNPAADPAMARYARRLMETVPSAEPSLRHEVRKAMYILLPMGRARIEQVADGLGLNVRTLQRQLDTAGERFSGLLNEVRRDLAMRYMAGKAHSLTEVGELLGYRTPSSFTRWFTAQFGTTPADWRRTRAVAADSGAAIGAGSERAGPTPARPRMKHH